MLLGAVALVSGGTYAWQDDAQIRLSELSATEGLLDVTLVENFTELSGWQAGSGNACAPMQVSVRNDSQQPVWVRLRFTELFDDGTGTADRIDASVWPAHAWSGESGGLRSHITWQTAQSALPLSVWQALPADEQDSWNEAGGIWLLDDTTAEGWAYYSCALPAGASTGTVLDSVTLAQPFTAEEETTFFYAIDIQLDVAAGQTPQWDADDAPPTRRDATQHRRNEFTGVVEAAPAGAEQTPQAQPVPPEEPGTGQAGAPQTDPPGATPTPAPDGQEPAGPTPDTGPQTPPAGEATPTPDAPKMTPAPGETSQPEATDPPRPDLPEDRPPQEGMDDGAQAGQGTPTPPPATPAPTSQPPASPAPTPQPQVTPEPEPPAPDAGGPAATPAPEAAP